MGTIGIFLGFAVLLVAVWRKYNLILAALVASAVIGLTNGFTLIETWNTYLRRPVRQAHGGQQRYQESGSVDRGPLR